MTVFVGTVCALLGLAVGSFLNVVIHRVPLGLSIVRPRSACPVCASPILARDNVPVVSWLVLGRQCRRCHAPISWRYPAVEVLTGIVFGAFGVRFSDDLGLPAFLALGAVLVAVSAIDIEHRRIPTKLVYPTLVGAAAYLCGAAVVLGEPIRIRDMAIGLLVGRMPLWLANLVSPRGMGFGDVRLGTLIGAVLGWIGPGFVALALFASFLLSSLVGIALIGLRLRSRKDVLPFGPYLATGAIIALLVGRPVIDWYANVWMT